jgi:hypothetical protein
MKKGTFSTETEEQKILQHALCHFSILEMCLIYFPAHRYCFSFLAGWQFCGSGFGRIRNFQQDPDPDTDMKKIIPNPDPGSSGFEMTLR